MAKFDTHGGYFAPDNYIRINEGGTHEENPNGGVQMGVDEQGIPNVVEEDETIYDDYVFSDNITVDEEMVEKHHLPTWAKGKLYSKVVDRFVQEAEERANDPISNKGLEAMLGRLRDSQEDQKQQKEMRELEDELSKLSPEQLEELESMLSQEETPVQQMPPVSMEGLPQPLSGQEQQGPMEAPVGEMPMMRNGGFLRVFDEGTPGRVVSGSSVGGGSRGTTELNYGDNYTPVEVPSLLEIALGSDSPVVRGVNTVRDAVNDFTQNTVAGRVLDAVVPHNAQEAFSLPFKFAKGASSAARTASLVDEVDNLRGFVSELQGRVSKYTDDIAKAEKELEKIKAGGPGSRDVVNKTIEDLKRSRALEERELKRAKKNLSAAEKAHSSSSPVEPEPVRTETPAESTTSGGSGVKKFLKGAAIAGAGSGVVGAGAAGYRAVRDVVNDIDESKTAVSDTTDYARGVDLSFLDDYKEGGHLNKFDEGGWADFLKALENYKVSLNPGGVEGTYQIDRNFPLAGFENIKALEDSEAYRAFTDYVLANSTNEDVLKYLRALDAGTHGSVEKLFDANGNLKSNWSKLYKERRRDQKGGIYHFSTDDINSLVGLMRPTRAALGPLATPSKLGQAALMGKKAPKPDGLHGIPALPNPPAGTDETTPAGNAGYFATFPRYAGALTAGALGLYNAFQQPDEYNIPRINPVLPYGELHLTNPVYNPLDQEQAVQSVLAANAGTNRAITNAGLGPSVGSTLLASDYNVGRNLGTARAQVWDANNQRRNNIIGEQNGNASALSQFDYGQSRDRAGFIHESNMRNIQNDFLRQRMNYMSEAEKYEALQSQIDAVAEALSSIGRENTSLDAMNSNSTLYHRRGYNGVAAYTRKNGGKLKKCK